ncbi:MAG: GNAT family N-acetyltransferase [Phycisphaerales bacterium]|nr:GNAT family N-acetyltransferase [Planctomycetota bacterium]MCH8509919.1 GNAT family N-acetyltransferase [Phycisphaerales bacterium]
MTTIASSPRLHLRVPSMADLDALAAMWADPETMRYIGKGVPWTRDEVTARIERGARAHAERGFCFWTVVRNDDGAVLGQAGVTAIDFNGPEIELGYRLGREHWGRGYATEAARLAAAHATGPLGITKLVAVAYPENLASRRVLTKIGFHAAGLSDLYYGVTAMTYRLLA